MLLQGTFRIYCLWQPVIIALLISAGISGPVTLLGTIVQHNAEVLCGVVLTQMIREGSPVVYGTASTSADMRAERDLDWKEKE